jgi:hypothetical protein
MEENYLSFLKSLDEKLHKKVQIKGLGMSIDGYTNEKMTREEEATLIALIDKYKELAIYPISTDLGLSVGYNVVRRDTKESLLKFTEKQLASEPEVFYVKVRKYFVKAQLSGINFKTRRELLNQDNSEA